MRLRTAALAALVAVAAMVVAPATPSTGADQSPEPSPPKQIEPGVTTYTYEVTSRGRVLADLGAFEAAVTAILEDPSGWTRAGIDLDRVDEGGDLRIVLAAPEEIGAADPGCSARWSCRLGDDVLINDVRWRKASPAWGASLDKYRGYVVNHEVGHWLGMRHLDCPGPGHPAPVMLQQSIDLEGCEPNGRPLEAEVQLVADRHGTAVVHPQDLVDEPRLAHWVAAIRRGALMVRFR